MKQCMTGWITVFMMMASFVWGVVEPEPGFVVVTGDRVSLRAEPDLNAVLMGRAMRGDRFILHDHTDSEWVGVSLPDGMDVWVNSAYVLDEVVQAERLNIRSGPSLSHPVVGVVEMGRALSVRGQVADWLKIAPTPECTVWLHRDYADVTLPEPIEAVEPPEAPVEIDEPSEQKEVVRVEPPTAHEVIAAAEALLKGRRTRLRPDPERAQGEEGIFEGVLKPASGLLYRLVDFDEGRVHCYVRGNLRQMEVFSHLPLRLSGNVYWAEGITLPILVPTEIRKLDEGVLTR